MGTNLAIDGLHAVAMGSGFAFGVAEYRQGIVDLNGDGDAHDEAVVHIYQPGSAVAFVESLEVPDTGVALQHGVQVVVADLASGSERWRVRLEGFHRHDNIWPTAVDFDGTQVLVSFPGPGASATGTAVLVDETGEIARTAVPGPAVLWNR